MRSLKSWALSLAVISVAVPASAQIQQTGLQLEQSRRVGRTLFEYTYRVEVLNLEAANRVVSGTVSSRSSTTTVVDGSVAFGLVSGFGGATSQDTITIRQDRRYQFEPASLQFAWDAPSAVQLTRETALSAGATLEIEGGSLATQGTSGVAYQLELPRGAFAGGAVTITPVREVTGLVFTPAILGAADLTPDGTRFARAATLRFRPAAGSAFPGSVFGFRISAGQVELLPATLASDGTATIPVSGFSTYGLLSGEVLDQLLDSQLQGPSRVVDLRLADFLEWTKKFFERDVDYFSSRQYPPYTYPDCNMADFAANEALAIGFLDGALGGDLSRANAAETRLSLFLSGLAQDGSVACDDDLWFRCYGTAQRFSGLARTLEIGVCQLDGTTACDTAQDCVLAGIGGECFVDELAANMAANKSCGVVVIQADPAEAVIRIGESGRLRFTARDTGGAIADRALVALDLSGAQSVVTRSVVEDSPGVLELGARCVGIGSTTLRVYDRVAFESGAELSADAEVLCSAGGILLSPASAVVIGNDPASYAVVVLDTNGNEVALAQPPVFRWAGYESSTFGNVGLEVLANPADLSRATARYSDALRVPWFGPVKVAACMTEYYFECLYNLIDPTLIATADFQAVPDLRGRWQGSGSFTASGCLLAEDNDTFFFSNWSVEFTQGLIGATTDSNLAALFGGAGIGERVLADLIGTMNENGIILGIADYTGSQSGSTGRAEFSGYFDPSNFVDMIEMTFFFQDATVDTCSGAGSVTFTRR